MLRGSTLLMEKIRRAMAMKWLIILLFWFLYWGICFLCTGTDKKNLTGLRSYPDAVQSIVRQRLADAPREKPMPLILLGNLAFFTTIFSAIGLVFKNIVNFDGFFRAFWYFIILGEGLGLFDLLVIDLLWWRNTQRIRFSFLPDKELYQSSGKHINSFVRGIPLFVVVAVLSAWIVTFV